MKVQILSALVPTLALLAGCTGEDSFDPIASIEQQLSGREGKIDFDVDAPWRVEPVVEADGSLDYGPIPIQITISDAHLAGLDDYVRLGNLIDVTVQQHVATPNPATAYPPEARVYGIDDLAEIEIEGGPWPYTGLDDAEERTRPLHVLCEPWKGQSCVDAANVGASAKWYALAWYDINESDTNLQAGGDVPLEVTVRVEAQLEEGEDYGEITLRGFLQVHLGEAPLPTFGREWVYGDLHYHSQGTHNEGESGHSFRGVVRAMGTMGLGFVFATDHASYSEQLVDLDIHSLESLSEYAVYDVDMLWDGLRDLSPERFRYAIERIHDSSNGANQAAADNEGGIALQTVRQSGVLPRLFLGAEVDAAPETRNRKEIKFGNAGAFTIGKLCSEVPDSIAVLVNVFLPSFDCEDDLFTEESPQAYWVKDWQGTGIARSRQHVLQIPWAPNPEGFVPSRTSTWGGGSRSIGDVLGAIGRDGVSFLAHPVASADSPEPGPAIVPYSEYALRKAFNEPSMIGLQIWNGDGRLESTSDDFGFNNSGGFSALGGDSRGDCSDSPTPSCTLELSPTGHPGNWMWEWGRSTTPTYGPMEEPFAPSDESYGLYYALHQGAFTWDKMNLWGMKPGAVSWLPNGEPRRMFASGGSDAHGDFNYRRSGYFFGTEKATTTAIGTPRNLVDLGPSADVGNNPNPALYSLTMEELSQPTNVTQGGVTGALSAGRFSVTDGPALRIVIDKNRNGLIDDADIPMGGIAHLYGEDTIPLLVEWKSTPEFGPVDQIHLYVGVGVTGNNGRVYAPGNHGVRSGSDPSDAIEITYQGDDGKKLYELKDGYYLDPTGYEETKSSDSPEGILTIRTAHTGGEGDPYGHVASVEIDPRHFPAPYNSERTGFFVRAFAKTAPEKWNDCDSLAEGETLHKRGKCLVRLAYTNPIWAMSQDWRFGDECPEDIRGIDSDGDGQPDGCDYCPDDVRECGPDTPDRTWARAIRGAGGEMIEAVAHDPDGNVVVTGHFTGTISFGNRTLMSDGDYDGFVAKLSRTGELLWLHHIAGSGPMRVHTVVVDDQGMVTVAGWFGGRFEADGTHLLNASDNDMFVLSLSGNAGIGGGPSLRWVRQLGGAGRDVLRALTLGPDGSVHAAGTFSGTLALYARSSGDAFSPKYSDGGYDCVMIRFARSNGRVAGSHQIRGTGECVVEGITVQDNRDVVIAGRYDGQARFPAVENSRTGYNGFAAKYRQRSFNNNAAGISSYTSVWTQSFGDSYVGSTCSNGEARATGIANRNDAIIVVGHFKGCAVARRGNTTLAATNDVYNHGYVATLNNSGAMVQVKTADGIRGDVYFSGVSTSEEGTAISGVMTGGLGQFEDLWFGGWSPLGSRSVIVAYLNAAGEPVWTQRAGSMGSDYGFGVSLFRDEFIALAGMFQQTLMTADASPIPSSGWTDGFVYQTRPEW